MRLIFYIFCITFVHSVHALEVSITEISPHKVNDQEEWFEFSIVSSESVDMSGWKIQNDGGTTKNFLDFPDRLEGDHQDLVYPGGEEKSYFAWTKSPLSLPNDGGKIILMNELDEILDEVSYSKPKSGTSGGIKYAEVWNRRSKEVLVPLIFRDDQNSSFTHTKGTENHLLPTLPEDLHMLISEVSPQREGSPDFIELIMLSGPDQINLKYMTVKHNGTKLWEVEHDLLTSAGDYILIYPNEIQEDFVRSSGKIEKYTTAKDGLSAGSGTIEVILFSGTSLETTVDFLCYQDEILSQTEASRVEKIIEFGSWSKGCFEIQQQIKNESIARSEGWGDSNTSNDWFRHFNGSPGKENEIQNQDPVPVIRVQGSGKITGTVPFALNLTGEDSTDPDGSQDIKSFLWTINGEVFSDRENPLNYKIEVSGDYEIVLQIEDHSGAISSEKILIKTWDAGGGGSGFGGEKLIQEFFETEVQKQEKKLSSQKGFFDDFFAIVPSEFWERLGTIPDMKIPDKEYHPQLTLREKLTFYHPEKTISIHNLGMIFLES